MANFKCTICGAALQYQSGDTMGTCPGCAAHLPLPQPGDEAKINRFNIANHQRRRKQFDRALLLYKQILTDYGADAATYWSMLLCRYEVRYVKNPKTGRYTPAVNAAAHEPILQDNDYRSSLLYAQPSQKLLYESLIEPIARAQQAGFTDEGFPLEQEEAEETITAEQHLESARACLQAQAWQGTEENCEKALARENRCAEAYVLKLLAQLHLTDIMQLSQCNEAFEDTEAFRSALWFADEALTAQLNTCAAQKKERFEKQYHAATSLMEDAHTQFTCQKAAALFRELGAFRDAPQLAQTCEERAEQYYKEDIYDTAKAKMTSGSSHDYVAAASELSKIPGWKDADTLLQECRSHIQTKEAKVAQQSILSEEVALQREKQAIQKAKKKRALILGIGIPLLCALIAFAVFFRIRIIPERRYQNALAAEQAGDVVTAYELFVSLGGYKDSLQKTDELFESYKPAKLRSAPVGDTVYFGHYQQSAEKNAAPDDIAWRVLAKEKKRVLLVSQYGLDCFPYNDTEGAVNWESCSLRTWLNESFFETAFSEEEQARIPQTALEAQYNPQYETDPGKNTADRVFLLNIQEVEKYLPDKAQRQCAMTAYTYYNKDAAYLTDKGNSYCRWWLRSPGGEEDNAVYVNFDGEIQVYGIAAQEEKAAVVRPAIWVEIS